MGILEIIRGLVALWFFQSSWSYLGHQGLGLKFALLWLARRAEPRQRVMEHCNGALNTNPFAAGAVVGTIMKAEYEVQELKTIDRFALAAQSTLAAGGDNFFWKTLRPALSALGVLLALYESVFAPFGFLIAFVAVTQGTRAIGLQVGARVGRDSANYLQRRFDRWSRMLGPFAAVVTGMIFMRALLGVPPFRFGLPFILLIPLIIMAWLALRRNISQSVVLVTFLLIFLGIKLLL